MLSVKKRRLKRYRYSSNVLWDKCTPLFSWISFKRLALFVVDDSCRASDRSTIHIFSVSRLTPSALTALLLIRSLRYLPGNKKDSLFAKDKAFGHPPRSISRIIFLKSTSPVITGVKRPSQTSFKEIRPEESPDSKSDIGRMRSLAIRPAPLCKTPLWLGVAEPVSKNCPLTGLWSTLARTASQRDGTSCHSSINRGWGPAKTVAGEIWANWRFWKFPVGSPNST